MIEDFQQVLKPGVVVALGVGALLVSPMGGQPLFGLLVHLARANLDFDPHPVVVDHRGVERAIAVALRRGNEILEPARHHRPARSEEHTSELQSLMRISYAVFCLKKKTKTINNKTIN